MDTLYNGVLRSEYDEMEANAECYWNFDSNPDDYEATKAMLEDWQLVMNKTTIPTRTATMQPEDVLSRYGDAGVRHRSGNAD